MKRTTLACLAAALPFSGVHAALIHHYTFDTDLSDGGTINTPLEFGAASSLDTNCSRVGGGALRLVAGDATDVRPATVPAGVPAAGNTVTGFDGGYANSNLDPAVEFSDGDVFTIACWIRPDANFNANANPSIVDFGTTGVNGARMTFRLQNEGGNAILRNEIAGGNTRITVASMSSKIPGLTTLADGNWHHVAMVVPFTASTQGDVVLYIDGVQFSNGDGLTVGTGTREFITGVGPIRVGDGINDANRDFNGLIDDVRIYDEALDQTAMQALITDAETTAPVVSCVEASSTEIFVGQSSVLSWLTFGTLDSLEVSDGVNPAIDVLGQSSLSVAPSTTTTYTITGDRGGTVEMQQVTVTVTTTPDVSVGVAPTSTDGTVPVTVNWTATSFEEEILASNLDEITGNTVIDTSGPNFSTLLNASGTYRFKLDNSAVTPTEALIDSSSGTATTFDVQSAVATSIVRVNPATSGNNDRCYDASAPDAIEAGLLDQTRWLNCVNQGSFLGGNGAAEFVDGAGTTPVNRGNPNPVADASFPGITESYSFGDAIGSARMWYGSGNVSSGNGTNSAAMEVWFKPNDLAGGEQIIYEVGGASEGMYLSLSGATLSAFVNGLNSNVQLDHTLTTAQWTHVVVNVNNTADATANDTVELYVDGALISTSAPADIENWADADPSAIGGVSSFYVLDGPVTGLNADVHFEGEVALFAIFNNPLTATQVDQNFLAGTQDPIGIADFISGSSYTICQILGATTLTLDDDDPGTPSPLFTTTDPFEVASGTYVTPGPVTQTTTYTVSAAIGANPPGTADATVTVVTGPSYALTIGDQNPIAYYQFEEAAGATQVNDSSGNGNHSVSFGGAPGLGDPGAIGNSVTLDGASSIVVGLTLNPDDPDGAGNTGTPDGWSISALVRPDVAAIGETQIIASQQDGGGTGRSNFYLFDDGTLASFLAGVKNPVEDDFVDNIPVLDAGWCHVTMTVVSPFGDGIFDLRFYVDGVLSGEQFGVNIESNSGNWVLGSHKSQAQQWFPGRLDEIAFFDYPLDDPTYSGTQSTALIEEQVTALFEDPSAPGLLAFGVSDGEGTSDGIIGPNSFSGADLVYKVSANASSASIDNGVGPVATGGSGSSNVTPAETTVYTIDVDGVMQSVTVTVLDPVEITDVGLDGTDNFFMTATNLVPGVPYDMYSTDDPSDPFNFISVGSPVIGPATTTATFTDPLPIDTDFLPQLIYQIFDDSE